MLKIKSLKQTPDFCGPYCLKMVLDYYGLKKGVKELARLSKTTRELGTSGENLISAAKKMGFKAFLKEFSSLSEIKRYVKKKKMPVIVNWFSKDNGHYSVVVGIDNKKIYLQDPEIGKIRILDLKTFQRIWFDFKAPIFRSKNDLIIRRIMAIYPKK